VKSKLVPRCRLHDVREVVHIPIKLCCNDKINLPFEKTTILNFCQFITNVDSETCSSPSEQLIGIPSIFVLRRYFEKMNPLRIKGGDNLTFLTMNLNLKSLRDHQRKDYGLQKDSKEFKPTPPGLKLEDVITRIRFGN
jgi:hypothetical protein